MADTKWTAFPTSTTADAADIFSFVDVSEPNPDLKNRGITKANLQITLAQIPEFPDSTFRVFNNADNTKEIALDASAITTATTRTFAVPDNDGTIALATGLAGGQTIHGGTGSNQSLTLKGTSDIASGPVVIESQLGVGTSTPAVSAAIDITGTNLALLISRMTTAQKTSLTPVNGMMLYDSTLNRFSRYENGAWVSFSDDDLWSRSGTALFPENAGDDLNMLNGSIYTVDPANTSSTKSYEISQTLTGVVPSFEHAKFSIKGLTGGSQSTFFDYEGASNSITVRAQDWIYDNTTGTISVLEHKVNINTVGGSGWFFNRVTGRNSANTETIYYRDRAIIDTNTAGSEDGVHAFDVMEGGTLTEYFNFNGKDIRINALKPLNMANNDIFMIDPLNTSATKSFRLTTTLTSATPAAETADISFYGLRNGSEIPIYTYSGLFDYTTINSNLLSIDSQSTSAVTLERRTTINAANIIGKDIYYGFNSIANSVSYVHIYANIKSPTAGSHTGSLEYYIMENANLIKYLELDGTTQTIIASRSLNMKDNDIFMIDPLNTSATKSFNITETLTDAGPGTEDAQVSFYGLRNGVETLTYLYAGASHFTSIRSNNLQIASETGSSVTLERTTTINTPNIIGRDVYYGNDSAPASVMYADIYAKIISPTAGSHEGSLEYWVAENGANTKYLELNGSTQLITASKPFADGATATTQSALDNSTKLATTAYVDTAVGVENIWNHFTATPNYIFPQDVAANIGNNLSRISKAWFTAIDCSSTAQFGDATVNATLTCSNGGVLIMDRTIAGQDTQIQLKKNGVTVGRLSADNTNNIIYFGSDDQTIATPWFIIDAPTGDIGIGITPTAGKLHIKQSTDAFDKGITVEGSAGGTGRFYHTASNTVVLQKGTNTDQLVLRNDGTVEIKRTQKSGVLKLDGGDTSVSTNDYSQIALSYALTTDFPHFIATRHNSLGVDNAIDFYTCDGTQAGVFPGNAVLGLSINNGRIGILTKDPNSSLDVQGSVAFAYRSISATTTLDENDREIEVTANTFTINLPTAVGIKGRTYTVDNSGSGTVTLAPAGAQTIDGNPTEDILAGGVRRFVSNGANWRLR